MKDDFGTSPFQKELAYDRISNEWEHVISHYDENRRIEVLINDFLGESNIEGKTCLDMGCGLGLFSQAIMKYHPSKLHACDISPNLIQKLAQKEPRIHCQVANIMALSHDFKEQKFDIVVCSEVIEHTPDPYKATGELVKVLTPGGFLAISVPNKNWQWLLHLAQSLRLRQHYQGYENWVLPSQLKEWLTGLDMEILRCEGIHTIPFPLAPKNFLRKLDLRMRNSNYQYALNLAVLARKRAP